MKRVATIAAAAEAITSLLLLTVPDVVGRQLFAAEISGAGEVVCRVAGLALLALAVACTRATGYACAALVCYSATVAVYFTILGIQSEFVGVLLWPAAIAHAILAVVLVAAWRRHFHKAAPPG